LGDGRWEEGSLPFAKDEEGVYLVVKGGGGGVVEWGEDGEEEISPSFKSFLETYRNSLLGGQCELLEGVGVMESLSSDGK